jgi:4-hydroxy-tetrahydrodipicolinate synthase
MSQSAAFPNADRSKPAQHLVCFGVHPMLFAPFDGQGRMDRAIVNRMVDAAVLAGCQGIAILGEITEANRLTAVERRALIAWVAERIAGRIQLCVSVDAPELEGQIEAVKAAHGAGATWTMLQPPPVRGLEGPELLRFFSRVAEKAEIPVCVRNAPNVLGLGLTDEELRRLNRDCPNVIAVKVEADPIATAHLVEAVNGDLAVVNGRGALEMTECLRAGATGVMPGLEAIDVICRVFAGMRSGDSDADEHSETLFRRVAPLLMFLSISMAHRLLYGKQLLALRFGLTSLAPRPPYNPPHPFGTALMRRWAEELGPLPTVPLSVAASI